jgi:PAS domain S-box-containing protein
MNDAGFRGSAVSPLVVSLAFRQAFQSADGLLDRLPVGIYTCDRDGLIIQHNKRAAELWGRSLEPGESDTRFCASHRLFLLDGRPLPHDKGPMVEVLRTAEPVRDQTVILERPDGTRVTVLVNIEPLFDDEGAIGGAVSCLQDISELDRESKLSGSQHRLRDVLEALPAAVYTTDTAGRLTFYNQAAVTLWGYRPELGTATWCGSWRLCWPDGSPMPHDECPMAVALKEDRPIHGAEAMAIRPDGSRVPFLAYPTPLRDASGALIGAVNMLVDITERKEAEARQKILSDELNHRVKNTLAIVQALAAQTLCTAGVPQEKRAAFESRLFALSRTHDQLTRERWECAELSSLIQDIFAPYRSCLGDRVRLDGSPVRLAPKAALTLAMVLNELATNAAKYGSLSVPSGRLDVSWSIAYRDGERFLLIGWREADGPSVREPDRRGFGTRFVERGIGQQLQGTAEIDFDPAGVRCTINIPLPAEKA